MPSFKDAEELERETDRLIAERHQKAVAADRRRAEQTRMNREAEAKKSLDNSLSIVQSSASALDEYEERLAGMRASLRNLKERNRHFLNVTANDIALFVLFMLSLFAVFTLDLILLSYIGPEIAKGAVALLKAIGGGDGAGLSLPMILVVFALSYLTVELVIGAARYSERLSSEMRRRAGQISVLLCIALPLFIVLFSLINAGVFSVDPGKTMGRATLMASIGRAALLGLAALAVHGYVLRFGSEIVNAYGYGIFKTHEMHITRQIRGLERRRREAGDELEGSFRDYHGAVTSDGNAHAKIGPFGARMTRVVNTQFGADVIETPQTRQQQRPSSANGAGPTGPSARSHAAEDPLNVDPSADDSSAQGPSQAQQNGSETENEWPGIVYDMSDEDEVK